MVAVDTNIVVRLLIQDDIKQFKLLETFLKDKSLYIPKTVVLETVWVLDHLYDLPKAKIHSLLSDFFQVKHAVFEDEDTIESALKLYGEGFGFADALHYASANLAKIYLSFDKKFVNKARQHSLLKVQLPSL